MKPVLFLLCILLGGCVTTSDSNLTKRADPTLAVERYVQLGLEYIKRGELSRARKHLTRALEINEDYAPANSALGLVYHEEGDNALAEKSFVKALKLDPGYTHGRTYYGAFLFSVARYQEALEQFELAAKDSSYDSRDEVYTNIALCNLKLERKKEAITAYDKVLQLDRSNDRALAALTELLVEQRQFKQAQVYYNQWVGLIRKKGLKHSARSLWTGIQIANYFGSANQVESLALMLGDLFPDSEEYRLYKQTMYKQATDKQTLQQGGSL